jgi:hypothetical protein
LFGVPPLGGLFKVALRPSSKMKKYPPEGGTPNLITKKLNGY